MKRLLVCIALLYACGKSSGATTPGNQIGHVVPYTPPADPDPASFPAPAAAEGGGIVFYAGTGTQLAWKPPTPGPLTAASACSRWVTGCVSKERSLDDCARSVPTCATSQPWTEPACCPKNCFDRYVAARLSGANDLDSFLAIYLDKSGSCIPGLTAAVLR